MKTHLLSPWFFDHECKSGSTNLGDYIIRRAIFRELELAGLLNSCVTESSTWIPPQRSTIDLIRDSAITIVGGTNLLSFHPYRQRQFAIGARGLLQYKNLILMGVGWSHYAHKPNLYSKFVTRLCLSRTAIHSVRDSYTKRILNSFGHQNVENTACPTMWGLTPELQKKITKIPGKEVLMTITDYRKDPIADHKFIQTITKRYGQANSWLFLQGANDFSYVNELGYKGNYLKGNINDLIQFYEKHDELDYIGTRLHCGILALEFKKRALILAIDNRATEINTDTGLPSAPRDNMAQVTKFTDENYTTDVRLPWDSIRTFRTSLSNHTNANRVF